ncbi:MAG: pyroglutamyl-peptidase I [Ruminococcaceae bacterium]|nr:pyroglutamyl-peptidase I [Oscillospiraceae bacterium]
MKILVTGFEPFNGQTVNPSEQIVHRLTAPEGATLVKAILPVEFKKAAAQLQELIEVHQPDILLSIGQAGGRPEISVERVAINIDSVKSSDGSKLLPDNAGHMPVDTPIEAEGAAAYFATLPLWKIVEAIQEKSIPAAISNTAGTYLCNHVMYVGLHQAATQYPQLKAGFIHVPFLPEQIKHREDRDRLAAMPLADMVTALQAVLEVLATL